MREPPAELQAAWRSEGLWSDESLGPMIDRLLRGRPGETFSVRSAVRPYRGTIGQVHELACLVASGLARRGVRPGDVVAFQLPNWVEAAAVFWGAAMAGAVVAPIVHFYGRKEVAYILRTSGAKVLVTADRFGRQDFLENLDDMGTDSAGLEHVFVVGDRRGRHESFEALTEEDGLARPISVDPSEPALIAYTSGTTADPKGVVHTHRSVHAEVRQLSEMRGSGDVPMLVGAPVGHAIGMLSGLLIPLHRAHPVHLIDAWDPEVVLGGMEQDGLNAGSGSTFFVQSLIEHPSCTARHLALMGRIGLGGSPVPPAFADRLASMGVSIVRSFGCTEHPSITGSHHEDPAEQRMYTDGRPLTGVEIRLVDEAGAGVGPGSPGEVLSRGPDTFGGYTDDALTSDATTPDGFFCTGDIGVVDDDGCLTITDRRSDVIIRGGENVSAAEVEEQLLRIPGVAEVALVAAPDARLGEHGCAFVRMLPGVDPVEIEAVRDHLEAAGLARQKWPEEVVPVDDFPRTPSGKVKKFVLRERMAEPRSGHPLPVAAKARVARPVGQDL